MGLLGWLFGPKTSEDEQGMPAGDTHPRYGHLAEGEGREALLRELHERNVEERRQREARPSTGGPRLWGYERASHRLAERLREEQVPRWHKVTRKLAKLERQLSKAESAEDVREIAKRAHAPHGLFRKIERGMEKRLTELKAEGASHGELRRYERDVRKLERRLRRPSSYLR